MWRSTGAHVTSVEARRRAWDRSSLLTLFKQGLWLADAYVRLSGWDPRDPPVSASCFLIAVLRLLKPTLVLGIWTQGLVFAWQVLLTSEPPPPILSMWL